MDFELSPIGNIIEYYNEFMQVFHHVYKFFKYFM